MTLLLPLAACGAAGQRDTGANQRSAEARSTRPAPAKSTSATKRPSLPAGPAITESDFERSTFDHSTAITNPWLALRPGRQLVLEGSAIEDGAHVAHTIISTVTNLTKVINGIPTVVVWERDYSQGELVEAELSFFAQDNDGNAWYLGEYPEEYDGGKYVKAPAWLDGLQGAKAGIAMRAQPRTATSSYAQGWGPEVDWTDRAHVYATDQRTCVPVGCFTGVLVTAEAARDEPNSSQLKYYARGVGNVRVGWQGNDEMQETLALVRAGTLSSAALAAARVAALKLEHHAYRTSKDVYARTAPSS